MCNLKERIRRAFYSFGWNISRVRQPNHIWLLNLNIKTVIDVGANVGQSAQNFNKLFPDAYIYILSSL